MSRKTKLAMNSSTCLRPLLARPEAAAIWLALTAVPMLALPQAARAQDTGIIDLSHPDGGIAVARGVSADGGVVVGGAKTADGEYHAFRWTEAGGMQDMGALGEVSRSEAFGVSGDGSVVVGQNITDNVGVSTTRAFRWTEADGMVILGTLNDGNWSTASGVSADGAVIVGAATDGGWDNAVTAFRWTEAEGMVGLGMLNDGSGSWAYGVSADGAVVVGTAADGALGNSNRAFRWTDADGMVGLGTLNDGSWSAASGVSADGAVVVGTSADGATGGMRAFRWTEGGSMVSLGTLNDGNWSRAYGVSADGAVVVGSGLDGAEDGDAPERAFRWTEAGGMQSVEDWLIASGVDVADVLRTNNAYGTNSDGSVVVGDLVDGQAFIARVAKEGGGLVTLEDLQASLAATAGGGAMILRSSDLLITGAHSRPLSRRVEGNKNTFWMTGDWGRDDHGYRDGDLGLAELGLGHNFGPVQLNVSVGRTWGEQNLVQNGSANTAGTFLLGEALIPISGNLWATLGAYGNWGSADIRRGYLNAGLQDFSSGNPDVDAWGVRARFDFDKAYNLARTDFSPYIDFTYSEARMEGYTETGGGFPVRFDARKDKATELRIGVNVERPLRDNVSFVGTLEAAHRFEKDGPRTSGQVIGLFGFDLPGADNMQNWVRAGVGIEGRIADGTASLMLNTTTQGDTPSHWLEVRWQ
ncbi:autotransporter domain-containing protein, partial [Ciceribacter sp. RN22]|uniref:autotransporter domain-containing protein n=1 Tax=Ciceribacter sp. RN22 TaxID=2954932 RepID=UPI0020938471